MESPLSKPHLSVVLQGCVNDPGINPCALKFLFAETEERGHEWQFETSVSMLEVYNETLRLCVSLICRR